MNFFLCVDTLKSYLKNIKINIKLYSKMKINISLTPFYLINLEGMTTNPIFTNISFYADNVSSFPNFLNNVSPTDLYSVVIQSPLFN